MRSEVFLRVLTAYYPNTIYARENGYFGCYTSQR